MDRLQQAISKARRERASAARDTLPPVAAAVAAAREANTSSAAPVAEPVAPPRPQGDLASRWAEFKPLQISPKVIHRSRLMAFSTGEAAIPFDMLRTRILQVVRKNNWKRIAIVSPESGAGKSTLTANLGLSFSRMRDKRTIVYDFDMRRAGLGKILGANTEYGMADVLQRKVPFSKHGLSHDTNVVFGLNRHRVTNPSELLQDPMSASVLAEIESNYQPDIVLIDTPPLMANDDSHGLLEMVDCALLVVAAERTPMERVDVAERQLSELTNVMGIVLNRCRYTRGAHGYENDYY